jgi:glycosyltransferase involved in cell wall biosynthesis
MVNRRTGRQERLRFWLVTVGEPSPIDGSSVRLLRTGLLARRLADRGHDVIWWNSAFDHTRKRQRSPAREVQATPPNLELLFLRGMAYTKNVSLRRIANHVQIAKSFRSRAPKQPVPDLVLASVPTLELGAEAVRFALARDRPVVVDVRDLWPHIILELFPSWSRTLARIALTPMFKQFEYVCRCATAMYAITDEILEWGLEHSGRSRSSLDRAFPLAYVEEAPKPAQVEEARRFWASHGIGTDKDEFIACLFAAMGGVVELETVLGAAAILEAEGWPGRLVLCGNLGRGRKNGRCAANVLMPGWVGYPEIWSLMQLASAGLLPYGSRFDFRMSIPNKCIEYLSAGLPVVSSLQGVVASLLHGNACGISYQNDDPRGLADCLSRLSAAPDLRRRMSIAARETYERQFAAERVFGEMANELEQMALRVRR